MNGRCDVLCMLLGLQQGEDVCDVFLFAARGACTHVAGTASGAVVHY